MNGLRTHEGASLRLEPIDLPIVESDRIRQIVALRTAPERRRMGDARWLMCEACIEADRLRMVLMLEPAPDGDSPLSADDLVNFYRRFGFQVVQREPVLLMARQPR